MIEPNAAEILACETRIINCWPSFSTLLVGDWVVRMADGYSGRANSATAVRADAALDRDSLDAIEAIYARHNQPSIFRVSPVVTADVKAFLVQRGYRCTVTSVGMIGPVGARFSVDPNVRTDPTALPSFIDGVSGHQVPGKRDGVAFAKILSLITLEKGCFTLSQNGREVGYGLGVIDRGYLEISSVVLVPKKRGQGLGCVLVQSMLAWGKAAGATTAFLQVEVGNSIARRLYRSLGMTDLYMYHHYEQENGPDRTTGAREP